MDVMLLGLAGLSLGLAVVFGALAWRLAREERARSQARIAALSLAAAEAADASAAPAALPFNVRERDLDDALPASWTFPARTGATSESARRRGAGVPLRREIVVNRTASRPSTEHPPLDDAFLTASAPTASDGRQRSLAFAAALLLVAALGGGLWLLSGSRAGASSAAAVPTAAPIELVELSHDRQGPRLAVSGVVRNPPAGRSIEALKARVVLFDRAGRLVSTIDAPIAASTLAPGAESPFVVSTEAAESAARYRVSFASTAGIVPHVDRRTAPSQTAAPDAARASHSR